MAMFIRPKREPFLKFLQRAGAVVKKFEAVPSRPSHLDPPSSGPRTLKYGRKVEVATLGNLSAVTPQRIAAENKRPSMFGNARPKHEGKPPSKRGGMFGRKVN